MQVFFPPLLPCIAGIRNIGAVHYNNMFLTMENRRKGPLQIIAGEADKPLVISEVEIPCYVLENETRVITQTGLYFGLGLSRGASAKVEGGARIPRFAGSKAINPLLGKELMAALSKPVEFTGKGGKTYGYPATILPDICKVVLQARRLGTLDRQQEALAERCQILIEGLATVGIIALVDEATGYQYVREERALATILEKYIAKDLQPWTQTFPIEFYEELCRLKGWPNIYSVQRPQVVGHYTNYIVYARLAPGVLDELRKKNPVLPSGYRGHKHHQDLTTDFGHPRLREHLIAVMAIMRSCDDWPSFDSRLRKSFPISGEQSSLDLPMQDTD